MNDPVTASMLDAARLAIDRGMANALIPESPELHAFSRWALREARRIRDGEHGPELKAVWHAIHELQERQMSTQADVDALVQQVTQVETDLGQASSTLQAEIDALAAANPGLDLSALQAAVQPLDAQVQALAALKPTPPAA